jgi:coenzyme PQQ precursor peptide PqqA
MPLDGVIGLHPRPSPKVYTNIFMETAMKWETPSAIDLRFGFEITMYIANR